MCKFNKVNKNTVSQYKTINIYCCSNVMSPLVNKYSGILLQQTYITKLLYLVNITCTLDYSTIYNILH